VPPTLHSRWLFLRIRSARIRSYKSWSGFLGDGCLLHIHRTMPHGLCHHRSSQSTRVKCRSRAKSFRKGTETNRRLKKSWADEDRNIVRVGCAVCPQTLNKLRFSTNSIRWLGLRYCLSCLDICFQIAAIETDESCVERNRCVPPMLKNHLSTHLCVSCARFLTDLGQYP